MADTIDLGGLPVSVPGEFDYLVGTQLGNARRWPLPEVTNAAAILVGAMQQIIADAYDEMDAILTGLGYEPSVPYGAAISLTRTTQTIEREGLIYAPLTTAIPFTTTGVWANESAKFRLVQGVTNTQLASLAGAGMVGFKQSGVGAVLRSVDSRLRETVSVKDFGAVGDGIADDTTAVQAAINYCLSARTTMAETLGGGTPSLFFPQGLYKISAPLVITSANGFKIHGAGRQATQLVFTGTGSNLFSYTGYICCDVLDMSLTTGDISLVGIRPAVVQRASRTNTCFRFNGTNGGTLFGMHNVQMYYWDKVFTTTDNIVNCDNHTHRHCSFFANNYVWQNTNPQAVVWTFTDCKVFSTATAVFSNPGISLIVRGGDYINPGTFCLGSLANTSTDLLFDGINFENYQNIDAGAAPKFLDISGTHVITFRNCTARGGGTLAGKTSATLAGSYSIKVEKCYFTGNWAANVGSSTSGVTSHIVFEECEQVPTVVQTLQPAQGNRPLNVEFRKHPIGIQSYLDRVYMGSLWNQSVGLSVPPMYDAFRSEGAVNASTITKSLPILVHAPYVLLVTGIRLVWTNNTVNAATVTVWQDSTKAVKLAEFTTAASASGVQQYFEARKGSGLLAVGQLTSASGPLHAEFTSASNAGTTKCVLTIETMQSSL